MLPSLLFEPFAAIEMSLIAFRTHTPQTHCDSYHLIRNVYKTFAQHMRLFRLTAINCRIPFFTCDASHLITIPLGLVLANNQPVHPPSPTLSMRDPFVISRIIYVVGANVVTPNSYPTTRAALPLNCLSSIAVCVCLRGCVGDLRQTRIHRNK